MKKLGIKYGFFYALIKCLAHFPLGAIYLFMAPIRLLIEYGLKYRKKVIEDNLRNAFPEKSEAEIKDIIHGFYRHLFDCIAETVKLAHISDKELARRIEIVNPESVNDILKERKSIVLMLGHLGNWEWIPQIETGITEKAHFGEIYKKLRNEHFGEIMFRLRNRWPSILQIPQKKVVRTLFEWSREGNWIVGFIADQRPNNEDSDHRVMFFNRPVKAMIGGETIGKKTGAEFLYIDVEKPRRGYYRLTYRKIEPDRLSDSQYPITAKFFNMLEQSIRRNPSIWLWSHKRWKS